MVCRRRIDRVGNTHTLVEEIEHVLVIGMGAVLLHLLVAIMKDGQVRIYEPNPVILGLELVGCAGIVVFGLVRFLRQEGRLT